MASPVKIYQKEMHENLGFFANWLPGDPIEVGAIGTIAGGRFRQVANLSDLRVSYDVSAESSPHPLKYQSTSGIEVITGGGLASDGSPMQADVKIEFSKEGAFLFEAYGVRQTQIENRFSVASQILKSFKSGDWRSNWYLVESVYTAESVTILVCQDSAAGLTLSAKANAIVSSNSLADPEMELSVKSSHGRLFQILSGREMRPLYSCLRLRDSWFGKPAMVPVLGSNDIEKSLESFQRASVDELLES